MSKAVSGEAPFKYEMSNRRAIGRLPQNDRMVLAVDPKYDIKSIEDRKVKPAIRLATSTDNRTNFIGYVATEFLNAHSISKENIQSWGGTVLTRHRPEQRAALVESGEADGLLQEAIMTPWWRGLVESNKLLPLPAEALALDRLQKSLGLGTNEHSLPALDFADFVLIVRDDMPKEVAFLLAWYLVETRHLLEGQYKHLAPERSSLTYPLDPKRMAQTTIPLHDGAHEYYSKADTFTRYQPLLKSPF